MPNSVEPFIQLLNLEDFFSRALLGGSLLAILAGPFGCFVVWGRMAFIADALAHASFLGIALALLFDFYPTLGVIAICCTFAVILVTALPSRISVDVFLGILSHSMLALALILLSLFQNIPVNLLSYLFGDILAISTNDLFWIGGATPFILLGLSLLWKPLMLICINPDLAYSEGINVRATRIAFILLLALLIAMMIKIVGVLLIASLLLLPPTTSQSFAKTPETMAALSIVFGVLSVLGGLFSSLYFDTPAGPSIVVIALTFFLVIRATFFLIQRPTP